MERRGVVSLVVLVAALVAVGAVWYLVSPRPVQGPSGSPTLVGGDKDAHGCIGSAGYSWCAVKEKCLRPWEEQCGPVALDPAFGVLSALRGADNAFGYATSSVLEWRSEANAVSSLEGLSATAKEAHTSDQNAARKYFKDEGFAQSVPNEAGGPTGGLEGYTKGNVACTLSYAFTDLTFLPDAPVQVNSDAQTVTVSCGILSSGQ